ncbi:hypothetical protein GGR35_002894 [Mucilaginibacter phyllosphaerae]|uniref:Uncharacterized protein n=1 Tax=Mucilaginibacter phyllosphaerae TaxID=1812349 RepID=A0ABR6IB60_9SPHI|nr:hypothetical protein [Mucilaginibacter phyllosphaerae]
MLVNQIVTVWILNSNHNKTLVTDLKILLNKRLYFSNQLIHIKWFRNVIVSA